MDIRKFCTEEDLKQIFDFKIENVSNIKWIHSLEPSHPDDEFPGQDVCYYNVLININEATDLNEFSGYSEVANAGINKTFDVLQQSDATMSHFAGYSVFEDYIEIRLTLVFYTEKLIRKVRSSRINNLLNEL